MLKMKILLLGKNGQLGFDLCRLLASDNSIELIAYDRTNCDVSQVDAIAMLGRIHFDVLINCTAYTNVEKAETHIADAFQINAYAVSELAKVCEEKNAKFIHFSTDYVFGDSKDKRPLTEIDAPAPLNIYGASKLMGESLAQRYCSKAYILRSASLYGTKGASGKGGNFITTILRIAKEKGEVSVVDDQWMSPTSTQSLAQMTVDLIKSEALPGVYHATNTGVASWYEFAKCFIGMAGVDCVVNRVSASTFPVVAQRPVCSVLSSRKLDAFITVVPHWETALKRYLLESNLLDKEHFQGNLL